MDRARLAQALTELYGRSVRIERDARGLYVGTNHRLPPDMGLTVGTPMTSIQCDQLLSQDIDAAWQQVLACWPEADEYPEVIQQTLAHLAFERGAKLADPHVFVVLVDNGDWRGAAMVLEQTQWAHAHYDRARRLVAWLRAA